MINYHNITYPDMNNGDGLRVVLWLSGCSHHCYHCQNPQTWDANSGILFDKAAKEELFHELNKKYISGLTLTGGDPLYEENLNDILELVSEIRHVFPTKTIWIYTGYQWSDIFDEGVYLLKNSPELKRRNIVKQCDILVDGRYVESQRDITLKWRGSSNQRVIDIKHSLKAGDIVLYDNDGSTGLD